MKAVVLLSGGIDSSTTLYYAKHKGYDCHCLIFDYEQRHRREIISAKKLAKLSGCSFKVVKFNLPWKGSALLDKKISIPERRSFREIKSRIPRTYVPARNTIFLSYAASYAETIRAKAIFIGANAVDFSGYPDCRPAYYEVFNKLIKYATKVGVKGNGIKILTPLIKKTKAQIIKLGMRLKVPYEHTWSCYNGEKRPCLKCDSCILRAKGFNEAGFIDPALARKGRVGPLIKI